MKLAMIKPTLTKPKVISSIIGKASKNVKGLNGMPKMKPKAKTITP